MHSEPELEIATRSPTRGRNEAGVPSVEVLRTYFPEIEVIELLGSGGMGAVYKARQPRLDRFVALKVLSCPPEYHADFALRFEREAQVLAKLNHPNIVTIFDFGEIDRSGEPGRFGNLFFFLMEYVDGADLNQIIRTGELAPDQALKIVPQICDALQFAHDEEIIHRDIKPANILVDQKGNVRIADFGLAKLIGGDIEDAMMTGLTMTGISMGTPHYMAPEQWETPNKVDHRADIYALGVVFYEMLTGERPHGIFDPPSKKVGVDGRIDIVVRKAMEREISLRYQRASEIKEDVTRVLTTLAGSPHPNEKDSIPRMRNSRRSTGWTFVAGVAAIVVAVAGWKGLSTHPPDETGLEPQGINSIAGRVAGEEHFFEIAPGIKIPFLWCPPGEFWMGSPENEVGRRPDETSHRVTLTEGFWLARTEFTHGDWEAITSQKARQFSEVGPRGPVVMRSWDQVAGENGFLEKIQPSAPDGWRFDLPTEAQWEYACRAGTGTRWFFGDGDSQNRLFFHRFANFADRNSTKSWAMKDLDDGVGDEPAPVGSYQPNPWGFLDIVGNVAEFCRDWYGNYPEGAVTDPEGPTDGKERVIRGATYINGWTDLRSASRGSIEPDFVGSPTTGFRLALVPKRQP